MASAWQSVVSIHQRIVDNGDKRTDQWLLVYSPVPVALIFLVYLFVVWAGPRLMKHREPLDLKGVLIVYNFAMVGLSGYMFYEFLVTSWLSNYSYLCQPVDYSSSPLAVRMAKACWWFFFSKVIELSDTLQFLLFLLHTGQNLFTAIIRATSTRRSRNKTQWTHMWPLEGTTCQQPNRFPMVLVVNVLNCGQIVTGIVSGSFYNVNSWILNVHL
ncbi:ELOVL fatty acid elongase 8b isoform X4 [Sander lucioperca]|uniref:ELOVL fatty acid elongase 8b isoform X4 n=1 Tax=Sander lucioperca TaxID=283035 RepID=UPI0016539458|nr:ELOVL fatty acid elongase 8b isoform X4 [Sander lucioperca]